MLVVVLVVGSTEGTLTVRGAWEDPTLPAQVLMAAAAAAAAVTGTSRSTFAQEEKQSTSPNEKLAIATIGVNGQGSLVMVSPRRTMPGSTTLAQIPRRLCSRPSRPLIQRCAARPNRRVNFAHPVCGLAVTSITADPSASRVPGGTFA